MKQTPAADAKPMTAEQVLQALSNCGNRIPVEALRQAAAHREFLTEPLLAALASHVAQTQDPLAKWDDSQSLPDMAMYLLAQFREPRAFTLYSELCRLPEDRSEYWLGDMLLEDFPGFLASTCNGDAALIQALAADASVYEYARWTAINALIVLVAEGAWPRAAMIAWLAQRIVIEPRRSDNPFWSGHLVTAVMNLAAAELLHAVRQAYTEGLMSESFIALEEVEDACRQSPAAALLHSMRSHHYVTDPAADMAWQSRYDDDEEPYIRPGLKIGRNDPCPCGSGRKYKKCCMNESATQILESGFGSPGKH